MRDPAILPPGILDLDARVLFFPVRHFSPMAARQVRALIERVRPAAVLVEGPAEFNDRIDELFLPHTLPIAIYTFVQYVDSGTGAVPPTTARRGRGGFYPFCAYAPEWQALQAGREVGADVRFIDLPWAQLARYDDVPDHRYADTPFSAGAYIGRLCAELGVPDYDALWDTLFEIDPDLTLPAYFERMHTFCAHMRAARPESAATLAREAYMARHIRRALAETDGRLVVVTGGAHSAPLYRRVVQGMVGPPPPAADRSVGVTAYAGSALTPYTYARLDGLTGFDAGMPSPGFYDHVWNQADPAAPVHRDLLAQVARMLRARGQPVSAADLIAVETTAGGLAALRGHARIWRRDLVDGIIGALVKEELVFGFRHAFLDALLAVLRGSRQGKLADGVTLPPLVHDIHEQLRSVGLDGVRVGQVTLDLATAAGAARSRVLHRLRVLGIGGFHLESDGAFDAPPGMAPAERWQIARGPSFDAACIVAAVWGATLRDAAVARLGDGLEAAVTGSAAAAAAAVLDLARIGGLDATGVDADRILLDRLAARIERDGDFFSVAAAVQTLLTLYRYATVPDAVDDAAVGRLLRVALRRALWLLESIGDPAARTEAFLDGVRALHQTYVRCADVIDVAPEVLVAQLRRMSADRAHVPLVRGAASGVLWSMGAADATTLAPSLRAFAQPAQLGDFLAGLFYLAREAAQRAPALLHGIDLLLAGYDDDAFLTALPALRLAFSVFTPREKHHLAATLFKDAGAVADGLAVSAEAAAAVLAWENRLFEVMARYGVGEKGKGES